MSSGTGVQCNAEIANLATAHYPQAHEAPLAGPGGRFFAGRGVLGCTRHFLIHQDYPCRGQRGAGQCRRRQGMETANQGRYRHAAKNSGRDGWREPAGGQLAALGNRYHCQPRQEAAHRLLEKIPEEQEPQPTRAAIGV